MPSPKAPTPGNTSARARAASSGVEATLTRAPQASKARHTLRRLLRP